MRSRRGTVHSFHAAPRGRQIGDICHGNYNPKLVCHFPKLCRRGSLLNIARKTEEGVDVIEKVFGLQHDAPPSLEDPTMWLSWSVPLICAANRPVAAKQAQQ
jgi:hypothetical protein